MGFDISTGTGSGATGTAATRGHAHTSAATPTHATVMAGSRTPKVHCGCLCHQVLQKGTKTRLFYKCF